MLLNSYPILLLHDTPCWRNWLLELKISLRNSDLTKALKAFTAVSTEAKAVGFRIPACQSPKKTLLGLHDHYQHTDTLIESFL